MNAPNTEESGIQKHVQHSYTTARRVDLDTIALCNHLKRFAQSKSISIPEAIALVAKASSVSVKTIDNWQKGKTTRGNLSCVKEVERALSLDGPITFHFENDVPVNPLPVPRRRIEGTWYFYGEDKSVAPEFSFQQEGKITYGRIEVTSDDDGTFLGRGIDKDGDPILFRGEILGEGLFLRGTYDLDNPCILISGSFFVKFREDGATMVGGGFQRETGQQAAFGCIFLSLYLARDKTRLPRQLEYPE